MNSYLILHFDDDCSPVAAGRTTIKTVLSVCYTSRPHQLTLRLTPKYKELRTTDYDALGWPSSPDPLSVDALEKVGSGLNCDELSLDELVELPGEC